MLLSLHLCRMQFIFKLNLSYLVESYEKTNYLEDKLRYYLQDNKISLREKKIGLTIVWHVTKDQELSSF